MATATLFTGTGLSLLPELLYPEKYKEFYGFYVYDDTYNKVPFPPPPQLVVMVRQELSKILPDVSSDKVDPFIITGLDRQRKEDGYTLHNVLSYIPVWGSLKSNKGSVMGIPFFFQYSVDSELDELTHVMKEGGFEFPSDHLAMAFSRTMLLSDAAKRFAISRALRRLSYDSFKWKLASFSAGCVSGAVLWLLSNLSMDLAKSAAWARSVSVICVLVAIANYVLIRSLFFNHIERKSERKCADMGPDYVAGGYEFYEKTISRNKVARLLKGGAYRYNPYGNEIKFWDSGTVNRFNEFDAYCKTLTTMQVE